MMRHSSDEPLECASRSTNAACYQRAMAFDGPCSATHYAVESQLARIVYHVGDPNEAIAEVRRLPEFEL